MAGNKASWTPERRALQTERTRAAMADPARRATAAAVMRKLRADPRHEARRIERRWCKENRRKQSKRAKEQNRDPAFVNKRVSAAAAIVKGSKRPGSDPTKARQVRLLRTRGDDIPPGYEAMYAALMRKHEMVAEEALRIVLWQRARDL
jgi:hypothetical protein